MAENRCISCGDIIPEGKITCKSCEDGKKVVETLKVSDKENYGIKFEKTAVWGFDHAFRKMRRILEEGCHPSDTQILICENSPLLDIKGGELNECYRINNYIIYVEIGQNDMKLAKNLIKQSREEELMHMIHVWTDTNAFFPNYKEINTIETDYAYLRTIYHDSKNSDKEGAAIALCRWIESLPYAKELICYGQ